MHPFRRSLLLIAASLLALPTARAEVVVVVDAASGVEQLTQEQVINIFLGRYRRLPTGVAAVPVDQPAMENLRAEFYRKLVDKDVAEINAYWARLHFSGKTTPPVQATSSADVLRRVLGTPGSIAYVDRGQVDARLRIVLTFPP